MEGKDAEANPDKVETSAESNRYNLKWGLSLDLDYVKSIHGILTAVITAVSLVAFICGAAGRAQQYCDFINGSAYNFFGFVSMSAFLTGAFNYVLYIFTFYDKIVFKFVPWHIADLVWCGVWCFFYLIGSSVIAAKVCHQPGNTAAAIFGFIAFVALAIKAAFAYMRFREVQTINTAGSKGPQSSVSAPEYSAERNLEQY